MKKTPLTWEEHRKLGDELKAIDAKLTDICGLLARRYPLKKFYRRLLRMSAHLRTLRSELDGQVFLDVIPDGRDSSNHITKSGVRLIEVYYGRRGKLQEGVSK